MARGIVECTTDVRLRVSSQKIVDVYGDIDMLVINAGVLEAGSKFEIKRGIWRVSASGPKAALSRALGFGVEGCGSPLWKHFELWGDPPRCVYDARRSFR